jgi:ATP-dependent RNA/DNA helicase IGHMBP2
VNNRPRLLAERSVLSTTRGRAMSAPSPPPMEDVAQFIARQRRLLKLERDAEVAEVAAASASSEALSALESSGTAVTRLSMVGRRSSSGGRVTVELETRGGRVISAPRLSPGDIVTVRAHFMPKGGRGGKGSRKATTGTQDGEDGVLSVLEDTRIAVILDDEAGEDDSGPGDPGCMYAVIQIGSDVTYKRSLQALGELERAVDLPSHPSHALCDVLFRGADAHFESPGKLLLSPEQRGLLENLNDIQRDAVELALRAKTIAVIHGPPGSGKSTTLCAYIAAEVLRGSRVLVVTPSNIACDGVAEKLAALKVKIKFVRAGHPARVLESVAEHTLEARLAQTDEAELARDIRSELAGLDVRVKDARGGERRGIRFEQRQLRKELRKRENDALKRLLVRVDCILATTTGAGGRMLRHATATDPFDVVVVDEAGQASEVSALVAVLRGKKSVLAGDPFQLAPTVKCQAADSEGLGRTLLDRVFANSRLHEQTTRMLTLQYRMHSTISNWSSAALYGGRLEAAPCVAEHLLSDLVPRTGGDEDLTTVPWVLIDTAGCNFSESGDLANGHAAPGSALDRSKSNEGEASIIVDQVISLLEAGIAPGQIGVISPYSGQVSLLRAKLRGNSLSRGVEVATVDAYQGREQEAILISLVRSNDRGVVGFLADERRLNVAITRARRFVCIVTDSSTTSSNPFISAMIDYASEHGDYRSADLDVVTHFVSPPALETEASGSPPGEDAPKKSRPKKQAPRVGGNRRKKPATKYSPNEDDAERKQVEDKVRAFAANAAGVNGNVLEFPASLAAWQRHAVHCVAEELGLSHVTQGEGLNRFISVGRPRVTVTLASETAVLESGNVLADDAVQAPGRFDVLLGHEDVSTDKGDDDAAGLRAGEEDTNVSRGDQSAVDISQPAKKRSTESIAECRPTSNNNDLLRQAALARRQRSDACSTVEPTVSASTQRIIVDGVLLEGSRAKEAAATTAVRSRLNSKLAKQSEARRKQPRSKKK